MPLNDEQKNDIKIIVAVAAIAIVGYIAYKLMQGMGGSSSSMLPAGLGASPAPAASTSTSTSIAASHQAAKEAATAAFAPANRLGYSQRINNAQRLLFTNRGMLFGWQK